MPFRAPVALLLRFVVRRRPPPPPRGRRRGQAGFALNDNDDRGWIEPFWDELGLVLLDVVPRGAV